MSERILVLGATGKVGHYVAEYLRKRGADLSAGVTRLEKSLHGVDNRIVNFENLESLRAAFRGIHTLFMIAPFDVKMKEWSLNILEAARQTGISYIVRSSGIGADPDSGALLARVQGEIDQALKQSGVDYCIVRPNTFMQNFITYQLAIIKERGCFFFPQGEGKTSFVDTRDVASVIVEALLHPDQYKGKELNVTGPEALTNYDVANIISEVSGREVNYVDIEENAAIESMRQMGFPEEIIEQMMSLSRMTKAGQVAPVTPTVLDVTGKSPYTFREFAMLHRHEWM